MGVTTIVRVYSSDSPFSIYWRNLERPGDSMSQGELPPTQGGSVGRITNMPIPWCVHAGDYNAGRFIYLLLSTEYSQLAYQIWQAAHQDGDWVRIRQIPAPVHGWPPYGTAAPMAGDSSVNGNRDLVIGPHGPYLKWP